jgi:hypothetical protein
MMRENKIWKRIKTTKSKSKNMKRIINIKENKRVKRKRRKWWRNRKLKKRKLETLFLNRLTCKL